MEPVGPVLHFGALALENGATAAVAGRAAHPARAGQIAVVVIAILASVIPRTANGQASRPSEDSAKEQVESDSDPTRPTFFSLRPEFYTIGDGIEQRSLIVRLDAAVLKARRLFGGGAPGVIVRFELPTLGADASGRTAAGVGDMFAQFVVVPYAREGFAWAVGSGLIVPTATDRMIGSGKLVLAPVAAPLWRYPGGLFFVKVQNFVSVAGDSSHPDINYLLVTPTLVRAFARQYWVLADSETRTTWTEDGRTGVKSGLQFGVKLGPAVAFWVKPEIWWGPNRSGNWNLKFGLVWYQGRPVPNSHSEPARTPA